MRASGALGSYVPGDTFLHRLDTRVKVVLLVALSVASFVSAPPWGLATVAVVLAVSLALSGTTPARVLRALRPAALVLGFSLLANSLVLGAQAQGAGVWGCGLVGLSPAGAARAALAVTRIVMVVALSLVFSATTMPPAVADALAALLSPLGRVGVPVGDVSMTVSIALRFIPIASEELDRIQWAQRARGARLDEGGVVARLRGWARVLVPLLVSLFRRADELAGAMADRCYVGSGRTSMMGPLDARDWLALTAGLLVSVAAAVV